MNIPKSAALALLSAAMLNCETYLRPERKGYGLPDSGNNLRTHKANIKRRHKRRISGRSRSLNHNK